MSKNQRIGCAGQGCPHAVTCAPHLLASEMESVSPHLCRPERNGYNRYEHMPERPTQVIVLQDEWTTRPRRPLPPNSVFSLGQPPRAGRMSQGRLATGA